MQCLYLPTYLLHMYVSRQCRQYKQLHPRAIAIVSVHQVVSTLATLSIEQLLRVVSTQNVYIAYVCRYLHTYCMAGPAGGQNWLWKQTPMIPFFMDWVMEMKEQQRDWILLCHLSSLPTNACCHRDRRQMGEKKFERSPWPLTNAPLRQLFGNENVQNVQEC